MITLFEDMPLTTVLQAIYKHYAKHIPCSQNVYSNLTTTTIVWNMLFAL